MKKKLILSAGTLADNISFFDPATDLRKLSTIRKKGQLIFSMQFLVVVWLAAKAIVIGQFTIGMMVAFLAYRAQFTERSSQLVDKVIEFKLARIHLNRLSDIVETSPEPGLLTADSGNHYLVDNKLAVKRHYERKHLQRKRKKQNLGETLPEKACFPPMLHSEVFDRH